MRFHHLHDRRTGQAVLGLMATAVVLAFRGGRAVCPGGKVGAKGREIPHRDNGPGRPASEAARPFRGPRSAAARCGVGASGTRGAAALEPAPIHAASGGGPCTLGGSPIGNGVYVDNGIYTAFSNVPADPSFDAGNGYVLVQFATSLDVTSVSLDAAVICPYNECISGATIMDVYDTSGKLLTVGTNGLGPNAQFGTFNTLTASPGTQIGEIAFGDENTAAEFGDFKDLSYATNGASGGGTGGLPVNTPEPSSLSLLAGALILLAGLGLRCRSVHCLA